MNSFAKAFAAASLAVLAGTAGAHAKILGVGATVNPFSVTAAEQAVPLKLDGAKAVTFRTSRNNTVVVVTYNAACAATGGPGDWVAIRISIDGVDAAPQAGPSFALCSAVDETLLMPAATSRQAVIRVPNAGRHTAEVFAVLQRARSGRLNGSSIVIKD